MPLVATQGIWMPELPLVSLAGNGPTLTPQVIDATGEKFAWVGRFWNKDRATKSIRKVGFLPGTVVSAGGSGLTLSLQDLDPATAGLFRPDETQDQTVSFLASALTTDTWFQSAALSADRSTAFGETLGIVIEFDGTGRLGADAVNLKNIASNSTGRSHTSGTVLKTGGTWATASCFPNLILECSDGTFGTLTGSYPASALQTTAFASNSTPDEYALRFQVPFPAKLDGAWFLASPAAATRNFSILLSDAGGTLATVGVDVETLVINNLAHAVIVDFPEVTIARDTPYRLSLRPDTTGNNNYYAFSVNAANHLQACPGGTEWYQSTRTDAGAWTDTTTQRPWAGIRISALDNGAQRGRVFGD